MFARVLSVWVDDEEQGLDRTMAALDRGLTSAERWAGFLDDLCALPCMLRGPATRVAVCVVRKRKRPKPARVPSPANLRAGCRPA